MKQDVILRTERLKKDFGAVQAVKDVSMEVHRGEVFGFLGPNGAGKTTTIGMLLGLLYPTGGTITLIGEKLTPSHNRALRKVGAVVGAPALVPYLSARRNLELSARMTTPNTMKEIDRVLDLVGLSHAADRPAGKYSTGMKQRLGLALALLNRPELLILDEPTNGMDPAGMREVRQLLRRLAGDGVTVFLSSHLLNEIEQVCDRVAVLKEGRVVAQGKVNELLGADEKIRLQVDSTSEAALVLQTLPGATDIQSQDRYVTLRGVSSKEVVSHLTAHGIIPSEVSHFRSDLESLFLELTQDSQSPA